MRTILLPPPPINLRHSSLLSSPSHHSHSNLKFTPKSSPSPPTITMASIKVHGVPMSTATMRVLAALYEKELDFELIPVDMRAGAHKQEPFVSLNVTPLLSLYTQLCYLFSSSDLTSLSFFL